MANQARLAARDAISAYYDGALVCDDELTPLTSRNVCLRTQARPRMHVVHACASLCMPCFGRGSIACLAAQHPPDHVTCIYSRGA